MNDELTHTLTITLTGRYAHGKEQEHCHVRITGDGSIEHVLDAFQAAMLAMGFSPDQAAKLRVRD